VRKRFVNPTDGEKPEDAEARVAGILAACKEMAAEAEIGKPLPRAAEAEALGAGQLYKGIIFSIKAGDLFDQIEKEMGTDEARAIFRRHAIPRTKREIEEDNNMRLLAGYLEHRLPVQQFARQFAAEQGGIRNPNGGADAVTKQLNRLLNQSPSKQKSSLMRDMLSDAQELRRDLGVKRGRPLPKK
jgi:hypothetical protein